MKIKKRKRVKQATALALSAVMAMSGLPYVPYLGANVAYAAGTVLEDNNVPSSGESNNTTFQFDHVATSTNNVTDVSSAGGLFSGGKTSSGADIHGLTSLNQNTFRLDIKGPALDDDLGRTTYRQGQTNYYQTRYAFGVPSDVDPSKKDISPKLIYNASGRLAGFDVDPNIGTHFGEISNAVNGKVSTVPIPNAMSTSDNVEVRQTVYPSADKEYVMVEYTVHNNSTSHVDFNIGNEADTALISHDNNPIVISGDQSQSSGYEGVHFHATGGEPGSSSYVGGGHVFSALDVYTKIPTDSTVGMQKRDSTDKSRLGVWAGEWSSTGFPNRSSASYTMQTALFMFTGIRKQVLMQDGDSAVAFSAYFDLAPNETKTAKFAIAARQHVYYADPSRNTSAYTNPGKDTGYVATPVAKDGTRSTIERVLYKTGAYANDLPTVKDNNGDNKTIYIMMQENETIDRTIEIPAGYNVTIMSADYNAPATLATSDPTYSSGGGTGMKYSYGASVPQANSNKYTLTRGANLQGPMFKVIGDGQVKFMNINLDGGNVVATSPMISVEGAGSKLIMGTDSNINHANTTATDNMPAAVDVKSGASMEMNGAEISGNKSGKNAGAVSLQSKTAKLTVSGKVIIDGNDGPTPAAATPPAVTPPTPKANVYLNGADAEHGARVTVDNTDGKGLASTSKIGISVGSNLIPQGVDEGYPVVEPTNMSGSDSNYSVSSFSGDSNALIPIGATLGHTDSDHAPSAAAGAQNSHRFYVESEKYSISVQVVDENGAPIVLGTTAAPIANPLNAAAMGFTSGAIAAGANIDFAYPSVLSTRDFVSYSIGAAPEVGSTLSMTDASTGTTASINFDDGAAGAKHIKGTMPRGNVIVTVVFKERKADVYFDPQGGIMSNTHFSEVSTNPTFTAQWPSSISKAGMTFAGWYEYQDANGDHVYNPTETVLSTSPVTAYPTPGNYTKTYFARWVPDTTPYYIQKNYENVNSRLPLHFGSETDANTFVVNGNIQPHTSKVIPGYTFQFGTDMPSGGTFTPVAGATTADYFKSGAPGTNASLTYRHRVDPTQKFTLNVSHELVGTGTILTAAPVPSVQKTAEQPLHITSLSFPGYTFDHAAITAGASDNLPVLGLNSSQGLLTNTNFANDGNLTGFMPNQDVTVVFYYRPDSASAVTRRFMADGVAIYADSNAFAPNSAITTPLAVPTAATTAAMYGYVYNPALPNALTLNPSGALTADSAGALTGTMPASGGVRAIYNLDRDPAKWQNLNFDFVNDGSSNFATLSSHGPISVLTDDGVTNGHENAMQFSVIKNLNGFPTVTPDNYHMVQGWYYDQAGTQPITDADRLATDPSGSRTVYVKVVEDPSKWVDVNFASSDTSKGTLTSAGTNVPGGTPQHLHYDLAWSSLVLPTTNPIANYELKNWTSPSGQIVQPSDIVVAGTYLANFGKVDATWGLNPGAFGANGRIGDNGQGTITVTGTTPGNRYVITDPDNNIIAVVDGPANGSDIQVPNVIPGRTYNVVEGGPDTQATVGQPGTSVTGSNISSPKPVMIPAIGDNRNVGVDPNDPERAQIVVNPADPDADYALIDSNGNVVPYPNSDNGWLTPVGSGPATVTFNNLNPGDTYTVVARRHGNPSETPTGNLPAGVPVVANPGDMVDIQNYTIKTTTNAVGGNVGIMSVDTNSVNTTDFNTAKGTSTFTLHADPTDSAGHAFKYWLIANGRIPGVTAKITSNDYTGTLDRSNVIFEAIYDVPATDAFGNPIAPVSQENRGGAADGEFAMDASQISDIQNNLTNPTDQSLINVNHADVRYKVIFDKRNAENNEVQAVKNVPSQVWVDHPGAFTAGWALDVKEERYVDGRLVQNATPSDAQVNVNVQLASQDTDMLDYEVWDLGPTVDSTWTKIANPTYTSQMSVVEDVANNGGLLSFVGNLNHTYVLVYSKTFKLNFIDNNPTKDHLYLGDTTRNFFKKIKVRKKDAVDDSWYTSDYAVVTGYADGATANTLVTPFDDIYGTTHTYVNWSKKDMPNNISIFDPSAEVTRTMNVYAYYDNNRPQVQQARKDLTSLIGQANDLVGDPFLKAGEAERLQAAIAEAQNVLDRIRGRLENDTDPLRMANYPELQAAIDALRAVMDDLYGHSNRRSDRFNQRNNGAGGGSGSSGRGGGNVSGTPLQGTRYVNMPLQNTPQITFTLGVDGGWKINPTTNRWGFYLNGGLPLNNRWGRIDYVNANGQPVTDWYRFDEQSSLVTGWYYDKDDKQWYLLNPKEGSDQGKMIRGWYLDTTKNKWYFLNRDNGTMMTGWYHDPSDGKWYFFDPTTGEMYTGWAKINNKWYFFNQFASEPTWRLENDVWVYNNNNVRPFGSLYVSETTPDGYTVNSNGEWTN